MPVRQDEFDNKMNTALQAAFMRTVSPARWRSYMQASGFKPDRAIALYVWNAAIGQSFHFPIQALEVALRNVIAATLAEKYGQNWWQDTNCLEMLGQKQMEDIAKVQTRHVRRTGQIPDTGQVIASLTFGFWAAMLNSRHREFWEHHRTDAFPYIDPSQPLSEIGLAVTRVQELRNRIAHHEPIFRRSLSEDYGVIQRILSWICPETRAWVRENSSVPTMLRMRP